MARGKWQEITGLWERTSRTMKDSRGNPEKHLYGKIRLEERIILEPGDEVFIFPSRERTRTRGAAAFYLKVKRPLDEDSVKEPSESS